MKIVSDNVIFFNGARRPLKRRMSSSHFLLPGPVPFSVHRSRNPAAGGFGYHRHRCTRFSVSASSSSSDERLALRSSAGKSRHRPKYPIWPPEWLQVLAASAVFFLGLRIRPCCATISAPCWPVPAADCSNLVQRESTQESEGAGASENVDAFEDEVKAAFESWKSKTYALTVPLRIVALRNSVPALWIKNFIQSQGRRVKFRLEFRGNLGEIFSELSKVFIEGNASPRSAVTADIVSLGDTWISFAIQKALIEPIQGAEDQHWFSGLPEKWKAYLRRNMEGKLDSNGKVWVAPYRWGSIVIAYKKTQFQRHELAPIEDWPDLWRPDLSGKISMVDSPREVVGAVLKYLGASYNTSNIDSEVPGGRSAVQKQLASLRNQVSR